MAGISGHFIYLQFDKNKFSYFFAGVSAFFSEQQAFLSLLHSVAFVQVSVFAFLVSSLVNADAVEAVKPIVKANAKTIANFFMISIFK